MEKMDWLILVAVGILFGVWAIASRVEKLIPKSPEELRQAARRKKLYDVIGSIVAVPFVIWVAFDWFLGINPLVALWAYWPLVVIFLLVSVAFALTGLLLYGVMRFLPWLVRSARR